MTVDELLDAADAELTDLMLSRRSNPAMAIGHAMKLASLMRAVRYEHDRALWVAQRELLIERLAKDAPANQC